MTRANTVFAISPHLDDAALSAGAFLAQLALGGAELHILTLFAGAPDRRLSPVARRFHDNCGLPHDATAWDTRRAEDRRAVSILGGQAHHADMLDAVYRRRSDGRWLCDHDRAMFGQAPDDGDVAAALKIIVRWSEVILPDLVLTCAGVGGHVDHLLTREAAAKATHDTGVKLFVWEDLPYAVDVSKRVDIASPRRETASSRAWECKWAAIASYPSQLRLLWPNDPDWVETLQDHAMGIGAGEPAERLWEWS